MNAFEWIVLIFVAFFSFLVSVWGVPEFIAECIGRVSIFFTMNVLLFALICSIGK